MDSHGSIRAVPYHFLRGKTEVLAQLVADGLQGYELKKGNDYNERNQYGYACGAMETLIILHTIRNIISEFGVPRSPVWIFDGIYISDEVPHEVVTRAFDSANLRTALTPLHS